MERNDERERIRRCEICRFLLGEMVRPEDEGCAAGLVVGLCLAIAVKTAGPELAKEIEARGYDWIKAEVDEK